MGSELVKPDHLDRQAVVYVRQSTPHQVTTNQESLKLQYALSQRARDLGWREADIDVIDTDLGQSSAAAATGSDLRTWSHASLLARLAFSGMTTGLMAKAERADLALQLPAGLVRDPSGVVTKDPNLEVQGRLFCSSRPS